jgi:hypothetical protein
MSPSRINGFADTATFRYRRFGTRWGVGGSGTAFYWGGCNSMAALFALGPLRSKGARHKEQGSRRKAQFCYREGFAAIGHSEPERNCHPNRRLRRKTVGAAAAFNYGLDSFIQR